MHSLWTVQSYAIDCACKTLNQAPGSHDCHMIAVFLLSYDDDFSTFQERFESFLLELEKQRKTKLEEVSLCACMAT